MTLRFKLFAAFFLFIVIPLFLLGIAAYYFLSGMIEQKYSKQTSLTLKALSQNVDFIFSEMNKVTDSAIANKAIQDLLNNRNGYNSENLTDIDYLELNATQRNFRELLVNHPSISYAFMYTLQNERVLTLFSRGNFTAMPFQKLKEQEIFQAVMDRKGLPKWVGPYEYPELTGFDPVFTQIRVVKDIDTLSDKGILLVQIKNSGLEDVFRYFRYTQEENETRFLIVNDNGLILFDSSDQINGKRIGEFAEGAVPLTKQYQSNRKAFNGRDSVISSIKLGKENWYLMSVTSWSSLSREITLYSKWVAGVTLLCLLSAFVFILFFVNRIAKSISRTVHFMRRMERGDLNARIQIKGNDEASFLARGYNSLVQRVSELLEEVKRQQERKTRAEMLVLQAQIKPHFLFNALESINVLAIQNQGKKVSQMVTMLGNMLRISIQQKEEITIEQELEHLNNYLEIQKFRFEDLFDFEIDIPSNLASYKILKLTLQPLVENSIQHGFEGIDYMGHIRVLALEDADRIEIFIEDNGIGIPVDKLAEFEYKQDVDAAAFHVDSPQLGERRGLGVRNVADRIRIQYGNRYGLFICSEFGKGTTIKIVIPKLAGSVSHEVESAVGR